MPRTKKTSVSTDAAPAPAATSVPSGNAMATIADIRTLSSIMKLFASHVKDGNIHFREDGIHISGMDMSHVCLLRCHLGADVMMYKKPETDTTIGVSFPIVAKIVGAFSGARCVSLIPKDETLKIQVDTSKGESEFEVNLMEIEMDELEIPDLEYDVNLRLAISELKDAVDQADKLEADGIEIICSPDGTLRMNYKTDLLSGNVAICGGKEVTITEESKACIATGYIKGFFQAGIVSPSVDLKYSGNEVPLLVHCPLLASNGELSETSFVEIHIAPRVNDDE